jgi:DNA-binding HxlR family transcriptional regulator
MSEFQRTQSDQEQVDVKETQPVLKWDKGTAYDFFISLDVIHNPEHYALRPSWAAGVRSRLSQDSRQTFDKVLNAPCGINMVWIHGLPEPKNASTAIWSVRDTPVEERVAKLICPVSYSQELEDLLAEVSRKGSWDESNFEYLKQTYRQVYSSHKGKKVPGKDNLKKILDIWADTIGYGEKYLEALEDYYSVFFSEEEKHITRFLNDGLQQAMDLSNQLPLKNLLENLTQGLQFEEVDKFYELILAPSFWSTPLAYIDTTGNDKTIIVFGVRPASESLIPGETIPDALLRGLKAVSDPTRLRILHYLAQKPSTPGDLSRKLRLRPPTVTHHLKALRLAGLVQHSIGSKDEGKYSTREESLEELCLLMKTFIG